MKDCFGTVISSLKKMKECVRCELLVECRSINWQDPEPGQETVGAVGHAAAGGGAGTGRRWETGPRSPAGAGGDS
jgi:hypothetical protein